MLKICIIVGYVQVKIWSVATWKKLKSIDLEHCTLLQDIWLSIGEWQNWFGILVEFSTNRLNNLGVNCYGDWWVHLTISMANNNIYSQLLKILSMTLEIISKWTFNQQLSQIYF
jgi:hypothetical protein